MRKLLTLILFLLVTGLTVNAQTQKGDQLIGGNISFGIASGKSDYLSNENFNYNYSYKNKVTSIAIGPVYSYFIADKLDLGVSLGYGTDKTTYNYSVVNTSFSALPYKINSQSYLGGIYLRKYFLYNQKVGIRTGPFAEYQKYKSAYTYIEPQVYNNNNNQNGSTVAAGLVLDFVYFPTNRIGVIANLGSLSYSHINNKYQNASGNQDSQTDAFGLKLVSALNLSLVYRLK